MVSLKLESSSNEAAHTFSPLAIERWEKLSKAEQHIFLNNAYCSHCKTAVTIVNVSGTVEGVTLVSGVLADKAYDTNELREWLESRGIKAVIPPKSNRKDEIECDYWHYKKLYIYPKNWVLTASICLIVAISSKPL